MNLNNATVCFPNNYILCMRNKTKRICDSYRLDTKCKCDVNRVLLRRGMYDL
jgi:hypothetical protein